MEQTETEPAATSEAQVEKDPQEPIESSEHQDNPSVTEAEVDSAEEASQDKSETSTDVPAIEEEPEISVDPDVVEKLTTGLLGLYLPNLQKAKGSLNEVLHNQEVLIETVTQENAKFTESAAMRELVDTMKDARVYHAKLLNLKKEMNGLLDKSAKLKKRAVKLQQQKHREVLEKAVQRDRELDREKMLTAKVVRSNTKKEPEPDT